MSIRARRDVFQAIADPNRRRIINLISRESMNLNAITDKFDISRPAISQHIKILTECGIVVVRQKGRERYCEANLETLNEVYEWAGQYKAFWKAKLLALKNMVEQDSSSMKPEKQNKSMSKKSNYEK
jgi:DNA-binding transcriptional ArsR family regulator